MLYLGEQLAKNGHKPTFLLGARSSKDLLQLEQFAQYGPVYTTTEDGSHGEKGYVTYPSYQCTAVYSSILGNYGQETIHASDYDACSYLFALTLQGAPIGATVTFAIRPYTERNGVKYYGAYQLISYVDGEFVTALSVG